MLFLLCFIVFQDEHRYCWLCYFRRSWGEKWTAFQREPTQRAVWCRLKELGLPGDAMGSEDFGSGWLGLFWWMIDLLYYYITHKHVRIWTRPLHCIDTRFSKRGLVRVLGHTNWGNQNMLMCFRSGFWYFRLAVSQKCSDVLVCLLSHTYERPFHIFCNLDTMIILMGTFSNVTHL